MKVKINKPWRVAPEGHTVFTYRVGDIVIGDLAERAIASGVGVVLGEPEPLEIKPVTVYEKKPAPDIATRPKRALERKPAPVKRKVPRKIK